MKLKYMYDIYILHIYLTIYIYMYVYIYLNWIAGTIQYEYA